MNELIKELNDKNFQTEYFSGDLATSLYRIFVISFNSFKRTEPQSFKSNIKTEIITTHEYDNQLLRPVLFAHCV